MAALDSAPNRTLENRVLLRPPRGRVLAANPGGVTLFHVFVNDGLPAVITCKAVWPPHAVHVDWILLDHRGSLRLNIHAVWTHTPRIAPHKHDHICRPAQGRLVGA